MRRVLPTREKLEKGPLGPLCAGTELAVLMVFVLGVLQAATRAKAFRWDASPQGLQSPVCPGP